MEEEIILIIGNDIASIKLNWKNKFINIDKF